MPLGYSPVTPAAAGANNQAGYDEFGIQVYDKILTANQELIDQAVIIDADADFIWTKLAGNSTGIYEIRFRLPGGRYMSNSRIRNANLIGTAQFGVPVYPYVFIPAAGKIGIDIKDLSAAGNTVQICLIGWRRFRTK